MIVLKNLSRDYDIDPYKLRQLLRKEFGKHRRWKWEQSDPELAKVKTFLDAYAKKTSSSPGSSSKPSTTSTRSPRGTSTSTKAATKFPRIRTPA